MARLPLEKTIIAFRIISPLLTSLNSLNIYLELKYPPAFKHSIYILTKAIHIISNSYRKLHVFIQQTWSIKLPRLALASLITLYLFFPKSKFLFMEVKLD